MRIAVAACVVMSGLFLSGAGAALAIADPEPTHSDDTGGEPATPTDAETPAAPSDEPTATATAPKPTSQVGDGRGGSTRSPEASSKQTTTKASPTPQSDTAPTPTGAGAPSTETTTPTTTPAAEDEPEEHPGCLPVISS